MEQQPRKVDRKVIPRWRSLAETPSLELSASSEASKTSAAPTTAIDVLSAWRDDQSIENAAELLATAPLFGASPHVEPAAHLLRQHLDELAPGTRKLVEWYTARTNQKPNDVLNAPIERDTARHSIASLKKGITLAPANPISHVELARLHSILGQGRPAAKAMAHALALAPHNRFVLRSAARMLVSQSRFDEAAALLKRNGSPDDPWLAATQISIAELAQQTPGNTRNALRLVDERPPSQITELAAALATLELGASFSSKLAKRLFRRSSEAPNDNAVAQLRWANETRGIPFEAQLLRTERSFEARTGEAVRQKDWASAVKNTLYWVADEPFALLPASDGCFWAAELRRDFGSAQLLATVGLTAHPNDTMLLNNRAYARANLGDLHGARSDLEAARARPNADDIYLTATEGCIRYRSNEYVIGADLYEQAIRRALREKNYDIAQRALLHWLHEEQRIGRVWEPELLLKLKLYFTDKSVSEMVRDIYLAHFSNMTVVQGIPTPKRVQDGLDIVSTAATTKADV